MKLSRRALNALAEMICGAHGGSGFNRKGFPYRSSSHLSEFFMNCDLDFTHGGETRKGWVLEILHGLNDRPATNSRLPSDDLLSVLHGLMEPEYFNSAEADRAIALDGLNAELAREGLEAYLDDEGRCFIRNAESLTSSAITTPKKRLWSAGELARRSRLDQYLDQASEDELIEQVLVPTFCQLGFIRVSVTGHKDKALEFGKDLWMKFLLPTNQFIYFGVQAKRGKLHAAGASGGSNISEIVNQVHMMLGHPVWDPDTNKENLLDHVFIVCGGEITKQAKNWLGQKLDRESRRHILFLDRQDLLDLTSGVKIPVIDHEQAGTIDDGIPF